MHVYLFETSPTQIEHKQWQFSSSAILQFSYKSWIFYGRFCLNDSVLKLFPQFCVNFVIKVKAYETAQRDPKQKQ